MDQNRRRRRIGWRAVPPDTYLAEILAAHRARAKADRRDLETLAAAAESTPPTRPFTAALGASAGGPLAVIAEVKRRSPSRGAIAPDIEVASVVADYEAGGATCLSVLTDHDFFGGSADDLAQARAACRLPVLRKDFTVCEADVYDARVMGADAVLLIVAALSDDELVGLLTVAQELALDCLVEVHDEAELDRALEAGADMVGVNQRDLTSFEVDPKRALGLAASIPSEVVAVAESGIRDGEDARALAEAGFQAVLVGESLMRATDRSAAVAALSGHHIGPRAGVPSVGSTQG
jgi:indole-3-glycerol phosphate synthase